MKVISCNGCPLRRLPLFTPQSAEELQFIEALKQDQLTFRADSVIIGEGRTDAPLYTLLQGWGYRFKTLSDGRRQILNFLLPGDFIGVQQNMGDAITHGVNALTDATVCVFRRDALWELLRKAGEPASPAAELGSTAAIKAAVTAGGAPAALSRLAVSAELGDRRLIHVPLDMPGMLRRTFRAVWLPGTPPTGPAATLLGIATRR